MRIHFYLISIFLIFLFYLSCANDEKDEKKNCGDKSASIIVNDNIFMLSHLDCNLCIFKKPFLTITSYERTGNQIWSMKVSGMYPLDFISFSDNEFLLLTKYDFPIHILMIGKRGDLLWHNYYDYSIDEWKNRDSDSYLSYQDGDVDSDKNILFLFQVHIQQKGSDDWDREHLLAKYSPDGEILNEVFISYYGDLDLDFGPQNITINPDGNIYLLGGGWYGEEEGGFGPVYLAELNKDFELLWQHEIHPGENYDLFNIQNRKDNLIIDSEGNLFVLEECISYECSNNDVDESEIRINKFSRSGELIWDTFVGLDVKNDIPFESRIILDEQNNIVFNHYDFGVGKLDSEGNLLWIRQPNEGKNSHFRTSTALDLDQNGNIYLTGFMEKEQLGVYYYLTAKFSSDGEELWSRTYYYPYHRQCYAHDMVIDEDGGVYVAGNVQTGEFHFDAAIVKYSPDGDQEWVDILDEKEKDCGTDDDEEEETSCGS